MDRKAEADTEQLAERKTEIENQHERNNLEVLNSFDLIITTSMMQSVDESVSVCV